MISGKNLASTTGLVMLLMSMILVMPVSAFEMPVFDFQINLVPDKAEYAAGDPISYKIWVDYQNAEQWDDIDHCTIATVTLDPAIENIGTNMPYFCSVSGNVVTCKESSPNDMMLWFLPNNYHDWLPYQDEVGQGSDAFTVTGTIKSDAPECTLMTSTAFIDCRMEPEGDPAGDTAESVARISGEDCPQDVPEFPSLFLPLTMVIGLIGAVLFIRRM